MRIIKEGRLPVHYIYGHRWQCHNCKTVIEVDEGDDPLPKYNSGGQYDGEYIELPCPFCGRESSFGQVERREQESTNDPS